MRWGRNRSGNMNIQRTDAEHDTYMDFLLAPEVHLRQLSQGKSQSSQVQDNIKRRTCPALQVDIIAVARRGAVPPQPSGFDGRALEYGHEDEDDTVCQSYAHKDINCYPEIPFRENSKIEEVKGYLCRYESWEINPFIPIVYLSLGQSHKERPIMGGVSLT